MFITVTDFRDQKACPGRAKLDYFWLCLISQLRQLLSRREKKKRR
jgi:hypothetical protein